MNTARIAELLEPFLRTPIAPPEISAALDTSPPGSSELRHSEVSQLRHSEPAQAGEESAVLSDISTYIDILLRWNARINLTAVRDPEEIVTRHFGESLFAARHLFPISVHARIADLEQSGTGAPADCSSAAVTTVADLGSGAGFPGLPIKLWAPHIFLTLIESNHKKAAFLREVTRALTLTDVDIQNTRAETLTGSRFDVVTLRAVERFESILPVAAALVCPAGRLALLITAPQQTQTLALLTHFNWSAPVAVPSSEARILLVGQREPIL